MGPRLLREPDGLEGMVPVSVCLKAGYKALAEPSNPSGSRVNGGSAVTSLASNASHRKHPISAVPNILNFPSKVVPTLI
jgi:hypothetical protein